ncbi:MAG: hypothetical protein CR981_02000 [Proteobacteria bacterium]|nr:MAG: hypothetical protein CR981_02000 [Pseudomonadota bacterium]PIE64741.1 MAG: hypothetical protein CSA26_06795 [Desulfobacterales bacterium]
MVTLDLLESVSAFKGLNDRQLDVIRKACKVVEFNRDDRLFREGDPADHLWIVTEGTVDLRFELPGILTASDENTISSLEAQDDRKRTLGWSCFVPPYKMVLSAYCVTRTCTVIKIARETLHEICENDHELGYKVMSYLIKIVGHRFQLFQDELARMKGHDILNTW